MGNLPAGARQCDPKFLDTTPGPRLQDGLRAKSSEILGSLSWEILGKRQRICALEPYQMRGASVWTVEYSRADAKTLGVISISYRADPYTVHPLAKGDVIDEAVLTHGKSRAI